MSRRSPPDSLLFPLHPVVPDFAFELTARRDGFWPVAGADEVGRGPLAGPVVAAAVILDPDAVPDGLNDSKLLSAEQREMLFNQIMATATVSIASSSARHIDTSDILKASLDAMRRAICGLATAARFVLIDGRDVPQGLACQAKAIVKGDSRSVSIAAASIVAKVTRDRMMARADATFPAYGFALHAGYATVKHRTAIDSHGPCSLHRMSFRPFRQV
ncbi:ribonuclease HII [Ensifer sp. LCM 4579]|uniref:ribonuclease HII n=1 Tax=Ensifer sp. LCM 4579 TaxID=1848292 RepID=UPI0008D9688E|nr:ribonuclease HII [Ensifer sp. LCM 4579]OHV85539.1 ribonuclease HII [Ensifer sp. LCM 4579]